MKAIPSIKSVMTPFPYWIDIDAPLARAQALMGEYGIRHLPVKEHGRLVSVLNETSLRHALERATRGAGATVRSARQMEAYVVGLHEPLDKVVLHMAEHHAESALVVKDGKLAGIFTMTDACRSFARLLRSLFPPGGHDAA